MLEESMNVRKPLKIHYFFHIIPVLNRRDATNAGLLWFGTFF